ncbi:MAG: 1-(5-phosphoribosyl)-5-[(5-phosphoribosylamino)methylideneamino]imidazole-4-carboxamide isomerase [bacterium]|nr:1-(5-phosphoribosyl)-5-[(5-phosphoribosylamino)methylideneamino]imidazole-4-carboxamide isomerase [bacterium]
MKIIPAIDIIDGKCVRLTKGDYNQKKEYNDDPLEVARQFESAGITHLHLVDLDGAKARKIVNRQVLEKITGNTNLHIDFGGGIQSDEDIKIAFESGAKQITGGSIAVKNQELFKQWIADYGSDKIILGADVLDKKVATGGWQEISEVDVFGFIEEYMSYGITRVICTDISKDGVLQGPSHDLYVELLSKFGDLELVASGGVSNISDLERLREEGLDSAIVGKAIYENKISLEELSQFTSYAN